MTTSAEVIWDIDIASLKLTSSLHLKIDGWKTFAGFLLGPGATWQVLCSLVLHSVCGRTLLTIIESIPAPSNSDLDFLVCFPGNASSFRTPTGNSLATTGGETKITEKCWDGLGGDLVWNHSFLGDHFEPTIHIWILVKTPPDIPKWI